MHIDHLRKLCVDETIQITNHCYQKMVERDVSYDEIKNGILHGEIIEDYPGDYPYPSALVLAFPAGKPLRVVAGSGGGFLWIITAYHPDTEQWESDFKTRKEK